MIFGICVAISFSHYQTSAFLHLISQISVSLLSTLDQLQTKQDASVCVVLMRGIEESPLVDIDGQYRP